MECEICGKETGTLKQIKLDGTTLIACSDCSAFGKEVEMPKEEIAYARPVRTIMPPRFQEEQLDIGLEIVPDFGKRIRKARESKGLTVKELAMKIFEKESLLHRMENQGIKPSDSIISKLEKELGIDLKNKTE